MDEKLVALAIFGVVISSTAVADEGTVSFYGKLNVGIEQTKAEGCNSAPVANAAGTIVGTSCTGTGDVKSRTRITDSYSYIGFRGSESLGGQSSAFFQVENLVRADSAGGNQTVGTSGSNSWASRNSGVGVRGAWGEILFGRWDVYYVEHIPAADVNVLKGPMAATALAILGGQSGIGGLSYDNLSAALAATTQTLNVAQGAGVVDFGGRRSDQVRYQSPKWNGFEFRLNYIAPELQRDYSNSFGSFSAKNDGYGMSLEYQKSHFFANYSYYKRNDVGLAAAVTGNDSTAQKISLGTSVGKLKFGVVGERLKHESRLDALGLAPAATVNGGFTNTVSRERDAYVAFVSYAANPWVVGATYARAQKVKDKDGACGALCDKTSANYYQVTGIMNLSKRTSLYMTFAKIRNDENASYDFFNQGAVSDIALISRGADPQAVVFGVNHFF